MGLVNMPTQHVHSSVVKIDILDAKLKICPKFL